MSRGLAVLLWMWSAMASAATVSPTMLHGGLGVRLDALPYPPSLAGELESGLTSRLYARVSVLDGSAVLQQRTIEISIRYDLWDQVFLVTRTMDRVTETQKFADRAEIGSYLASLRLPRLFAAGTLPASRDLVLRVELLLNPIGREKLRMIRKWVAENSTPNIGTDQGVSASNTIFNRIFEQYAGGADVAAEWRVDLRSTTFRAAPLGDEGS